MDAPKARSANRLLASLSPEDFSLVGPYLQKAELAPQTELAAAGEDLLNAYFPHSGIISLVVRLTDGQTTEVAMIGRDSMFGGSALVGPKALTTAIVQSRGECSKISTGRLQSAADQSKTLRTIIARHEQAIFVQAQQSAGCLASHPAVARLARWLMRARDAAGTDKLHFTQDFLGQMIGVKRNAVSQVATDLQASGIIVFSRGQIQITDASKLKAIACECYETVRSELERLKRSQLG